MTVRLIPTAVKVPAALCVLDPASGTEPKLGSALGETLRPAPVPDNPIADKVLEALLANDNVPETAPVDAGVKEREKFAL